MDPNNRYRKCCACMCARGNIYLDRLRTADVVEMDLTLDAMSLYHIARFTSGFFVPGGYLGI